jgi:hypothetical protein
MSAFKRLVGKLEAKGLPKSEAGGIAYNQGKKKLGAKEMARRAKEGRQHESVVVEAKDWDSMSPEARDIVLHADNDQHLYNSSHQPIIKNLQKKAAKGIYNPEKAKDLWKYHADRAAMSCCKKHGEPGDVWHKKFPQGARKEAASHWEGLHRDELHESLNEGLNDMQVDQNKEIFSMLKAALEDKPATFAEHFANALHPKLTDTIEAMKAEVKQFMFNHLAGNHMDGNVIPENEKSRNLLSNKAKKCAGWVGGKNPTDSVVDYSPVAADFSPEGTVGTQHESAK